MKFLCCRLIAAMPDEGLNECLDEIGNIYNFYSVIPEQTLAAPNVEKVLAKLTSEA